MSGSVDATANETLSLNVVQPGAVLIIPPVAREGAITFQLAAERNGEATDPSDGVSTSTYAPVLEPLRARDARTSKWPSCPQGGMLLVLRSTLETGSTR